MPNRVQFPTPDMHENWQSWASALIESLLEPDDVSEIQLVPYTVLGVPSAAEAGILIYIIDESGGAIPAFSDGTNWRRVSDRAVIS